ncbi:MAG: efflux RND transporter permease subunit, partial [Bacteroidales bacterium]|nr:efflux RND transporter permease subunit [Bacteroidales bacterium]
NAALANGPAQSEAQRHEMRIHAAEASARELFMPQFMATAAICAMFFPIKGLISGYLGEFVALFPYVITIALMTSLAYAMCVVPALEVRFIHSVTGDPTRPAKGVAAIQKRFFDGLQNIYDRAEAWCFRHPRATLLTGVASIAVAVLLFTRLNVQMMPMAARDYFAVEIKLEGAAGLDETEAVADAMTRLLLDDRRVASVTAFIGTGAPRFNATYEPMLPGKHMAQLVVNTRSTKATEQILAELESRYEFAFPNARLRFKQMDYQAVKAPVAVELKGKRLETLLPAAEKIRRHMAGMHETLQWVHADYDGYQPVIEVSLAEEEAARLGVNNSLVSLSLAGLAGGQTLTTIWEDEGEIPVTLYSRAWNDSADYSALENQMVPTAVPGLSVPLRQVGRIYPDWNVTSRPHKAGTPSVSVSADMKQGCSQPEAMADLKRFVTDSILPMLPPDATVSYGGLSAVNKTVIPEILLSFICAVAVLFFFMLFHFKKISLAALTLTLSLLCMFGAFFGLWLFKLDFGLTAVLGLISLVGIIVRNGIIMFEYADELQMQHDLSAKEAAIEAGKRRMRPIFLTSCTTALGVLPMIISGDALWRPMGVVICFGTMLSIALIVLIMPVSYWQIFKIGGRKQAAKGTVSDFLRNKTAVALVALTLGGIGLGDRLQAQNAADTASAAADTLYLSLEDCLERARTQDLRIRNAELDQRAALAQKREALAAYFPTVAVQAFGFGALDPLLDIGITDILGTSAPAYQIQQLVGEWASSLGLNSRYEALGHGYTAVVSATQPLFAGGRIVNGNRLAQVGVTAADLKKSLTVRETVEAIEREYWQVVSLQEKRETLRQALTFLDNLHKDVASARAAGLATQTDLLQVELKRNELKSKEIELNNGLLLAKMNLCNQIGLGVRFEDLDRLFFSDRLTDIGSPETVYQDEESLLAQQEEMQLLNLSVEAKRLEKKIATGEAMPAIGVGATYGYGSLLHNKGEWNGMLYVSAKIPLSDWGGQARKIQRYDYELQKTENEKDFLADQLLLQLRKLRFDLLTAWEQMQLAREAERTAKASMEQTQAHYRAGLAALSELLQAQLALRESADRLTDQKIAYKNALQAYLSR